MIIFLNQPEAAAELRSARAALSQPHSPAAMSLSSPSQGKPLPQAHNRNQRSLTHLHGAAPLPCPNHLRHPSLSPQRLTSSTRRCCESTRLLGRRPPISISDSHPEKDKIRSQQTNVPLDARVLSAGALTTPARLPHQQRINAQRTFAPPHRSAIHHLMRASRREVTMPFSGNCRKDSL
jgi:hypothetical protein